jgi:hypothetical protein
MAIAWICILRVYLLDDEFKANSAKSARNWPMAFFVIDSLNEIIYSGAAPKCARSLTNEQIAIGIWQLAKA